MTEPFTPIVPGDPGEVADVPWAMQLAIRFDKAEPAGHFETCEAAARAVVALLVAAQSEPTWAELVRHWRDGRIRKLVRRARGVRWGDVQELPGVTVEQGRAAVRAFVPGPVQPLPTALAKLQVAGTELPVERERDVPGAPVIIGVSPHITMTTGKAAAQCGHAAQLAWEAMTPVEREVWAATEHCVRVVSLPKQEWATRPGQVTVVDAGFTELDGPTETTRAWWAL